MNKTWGTRVRKKGSGDEYHNTDIFENDGWNSVLLYYEQSRCRQFVPVAVVLCSMLAMKAGHNRTPRPKTWNCEHGRPGVKQTCWLANGEWVASGTSESATLRYLGAPDGAAKWNSTREPVGVGSEQG